MTDCNMLKLYIHILSRDIQRKRLFRSNFYVEYLKRIKIERLELNDTQMVKRNKN